MSTLRIISLIVAAVALIASLILGMTIMNGKKALHEKFDAALEERWKGSTANFTKDTSPLDKVSEFNRRAQGEQQALADTQAKLTQTTNELNAAVQARDAAQAAEQQAKAAQAQAENALAETQQRLRTAEENLDAANRNLNTARASMRELQNRTNELERQMRELGNAPELVKSLTQENAKLKTDIAAANAQVVQKDAEIKKLKQVSPDLTGAVIKSDPTWSFIVLDIGKERGGPGIDGHNFFVYRGDQYRGEVKVTRADRNVSIADIVLLPSGARAASIATGDKVLASRLPATRLPASSTPIIAPTTPTPRATAPRATTPAPTPAPREDRQQNFGPRKSETEPTPAPAPAPKPTPVAKPAPAPQPAPAPAPKAAPAEKPAPARTETKPEDTTPTERKMNFGSGRKSPTLDE
jgi:hypothetical protein